MSRIAEHEPVTLERTRRVVDVPKCPIATDANNAAYARSRKEIQANPGRYERGATLLFRDCEEGVVTDSRQVVTEKVGRVRTCRIGARRLDDNG